MIKISGSTHQTFTFPANLKTSFDYFADLQHTFSILPHISILDQYNESSFRMLYHTTELGIYKVRIICDLKAESDHQNWVLRVDPCPSKKPVFSEAGLYSLTAPGAYTSVSHFREQGDLTQVEYKLRLNASLPVPLGVRFMPDSVLSNIASNITQWRIHEIANGFIERSLRAYR
jgi:hypothetical protein